MKELFDAPRIAPSILSADFARLGEQVDEVLAAGARVIHVDVMDGHFVPPITIGPLVTSSIADRVHQAGGAIDVHLMIENPGNYIADFVSAGADMISVHIEADPHINRTLGAIREAGALAAVAFNPGTPVEALAPLNGFVDAAVLMSVNPGWGGQAFIEGSLDRVRRVRKVLPRAVVEIDGGIDATRSGDAADAGARILVAGSAIFKQSDPAAAYTAIAAAANAA